MYFVYDLDEVPLRTHHENGKEYTGVFFAGEAEIEIAGGGTWWVRAIWWQGYSNGSKKLIPLDPSDPLYATLVNELEDNYSDQIIDCAMEMV
jgi:hypothetical protein